MIVDEKFFEFAHEFLPEIGDVPHVRVAVIFLFDRDDPVIALPILFLPYSPSIIPTIRHFRGHPGEAGSSINTRTSVEIPSSAVVEATKPKS